MKNRLLFIISVLFIFFSVISAKVPGSVAKAKKIASRDKISSSFMLANFDEKAFSESRRKAIKNFVEKGVRYLKKNGLNKSLNAFSHNKDFVEGELYLFVYDFEGVCLAHGQRKDMIWANMYDYKDSFGSYVVRYIIDVAKRGGGWATYEWRNTTKVSFIQDVEFEGRKLLIGSGYYPLSKRDSVVNIVKGAVEHFKSETTQEEPVGAAFSELGYPLGRFVMGDLYLIVVSFDGMVIANGDKPGLIGQNTLDYKDQNGKFVVRDLIKKLKLSSDGVWIEYISKGARKILYAEKVVDKKGREYYISCGYYPDAGRLEAIDLVKKGYTYMEKNGISAATDSFSEGSKNFRYGDLYLEVYDYNGKCIANGANRDFVGRNMYDSIDEDGRYFIRAFIEKAKKGGGWIDYKTRNSYRFVYVESVKIGVSNYVIACGLFPIAKPGVVQLLVKGAASFLKDFSIKEAMSEFIKKNGGFVKGDLEIFVFDFKGICYAYGTDYSKIWKDLFKVKDEDGRPFVKLFINTAKDGVGTVIYKENRRLKTAYLMSVEKDGKKFVVGSSFHVR